MRVLDFHSSKILITAKSYGTSDIMIKFKNIIITIFLLIGGSVLGTESQFQKLDQLLKLLKNNLYEFETKDIEEAAIQGLIEKLNGRISLDTKRKLETGNSDTNKTRPSIITRYLENQFVCIQPKNIDQNPLSAIKESLAKDSPDSEYHGLILDLRYAYGSDYKIIPSISGLFLGADKELYKSEKGMVSSTKSEDNCQLPMAVLVNEETTGTAELLAAILQKSKRAIVIGNKTAGHVFYFESLPFHDGQNLNMAKGPISLVSGEMLTSKGIQPEIPVAVDPEIEQKYFENPYFIKSPKSTRKVQLNEADLIKIKEHQNDRIAGIHKPFPDDEIRKPEANQTAPAISDPCLARGIDFLKGVRLLRSLKGNEPTN